METTLHTLGLALAAAALLPWVRQGNWWIRIFDFPRLQLAVAGLAVLLAYRFVPFSVPGAGIQLATLLATLYQFKRIHPFTRLAPLQVQAASPDDWETARLRVMVANVWMPNRQAEALLSLVHRYEPDILLAVEADSWWRSKLDALTPGYPHAVRFPLPNTYGMLLYSRYPLVRPEVRFLVEDDIPSIETGVRLPQGGGLRFYGLHPRPPRPTRLQDSTNRDAELVIVGEQVAGSDEPVIVAGDLNDVAWSYTTDLFQRISGLLDPRRGRGMYNSFNARLPLVRFPLDHIFHSGHFRLVRIERLGRFGSDHFPLLAELSYQRCAVLAQRTPETDGADRVMARELRSRPERE